LRHLETAPRSFFFSIVSEHLFRMVQGQERCSENMLRNTDLHYRCPFSMAPLPVFVTIVVRIPSLSSTLAFPPQSLRWNHALVSLSLSLPLSLSLSFSFSLCTCACVCCLFVHSVPPHTRFPRVCVSPSPSPPRSLPYPPRFKVQGLGFRAQSLKGQNLGFRVERCCTSLLPLLLPLFLPLFLSPE